MKKYLLWHGRMSRKPYIILSLSLFIGAYLIKAIDPHAYPVLYYVNDVLLYLKFIWNAQRFHDLNRTGVWTLILIPLIIANHAGPIISVLSWTALFILWVYLLLAKGTNGENQYGPNALESITEPQ